MNEFPTFDLATVGKGAALHVIESDRFTDMEADEVEGLAACGVRGRLGNEERGVDARAVRVKGRVVCENCLTVIANRRSTERRPTSEAASSADGLSGRSRQPERRESSMAASTGGRKKRATARRGAPSRARSAAAPAAEKQSAEKGSSILGALYKALEREVGEFEKSPNKSETYTRLRLNGKAFAYIFPPRPGSVAVKIPKQLLDIASKLPKDHGFKRTDWGLTRTVAAAADAPKIAKALAVAAEAVKPKEAAAEATK